MHIKILIAIGVVALTLPNTGYAADDMADEHGGGIFHMFRLETDYGGGPEGTVGQWDLDGWIGGDDDKLWLKSEGEYTEDAVHDAEFWALYSRNIATFWDAQLGIRYDHEPTDRSYAVFGFNGLAPYFVETETHLFISDKGDVSARLHAENDFLITQQIILQPYAEINLFAQDVPERETGAGIADGKIGLQTRYEINRKFAPYIDFRYGRKFGETADMAESNGESVGEFVSAIGVRLMF